MLMCLNTIVWWIVGNGIAFGRSYKKFLGISDFMLSADASQHSNDYLSFLFALTQSGVYIAIASVPVYS
jgi:ammonia channel protein AmtB